MRSLFVLSLPRSMSSLTYRVAASALGLRMPRWTDHGEILNNDRHALYGGAAVDEGVKYLRAEHAPALFERITCFLDAVARPEGFAYKDVVHPFVTAGWPGLSRLAVLIIERPIADVARAVLDRGWRYPGHAVRRVALDDDAVLEGLLRAEQALAAAPGVRVRYDDLIRDEGALHEALQRLYPDADVPWPRYIDAGFRQARAHALRCRQTPGYGALRLRLDALRADLPAPTRPGGRAP